MFKVKQRGRSAKAAEERADKEVLAKFEHGDGAINQRHRTTENSSQQAAPFRLAGLQFVEVAHQRQGALNLGRILLVERGQDVDGGDDAVQRGSGGRALKDGGFDPTEFLFIGQPALQGASKMSSVESARSQFCGLATAASSEWRPNPGRASGRFWAGCRSLTQTTAESGDSMLASSGSASGGVGENEQVVLPPFGLGADEELPQPQTCGHRRRGGRAGRDLHPAGRNSVESGVTLDRTSSVQAKAFEAVAEIVLEQLESSPKSPWPRQIQEER